MDSPEKEARIFCIRPPLLSSVELLRGEGGHVQEGAPASGGWGAGGELLSPQLLTVEEPHGEGGPTASPPAEVNQKAERMALSPQGSLTVEASLLEFSLGGVGRAQEGARGEVPQLHEQLRTSSMEAQQLRVLFVQAIEQALRSARQELTTAHLRLEVPNGGWVVLMVAVHGEQVHVWARTSSAELGRQLMGGTEELQQLLSARQLRLMEVTVRAPEGTFSPTAGNARQQQSEKESYREREQFVRSFRWHKLRFKSEGLWQNPLEHQWR